MKIILSTLLSLFLMAGITAQEAQFKHWDQDQDGYIERHEFNNIFIRKYFDNWKAKDARGILEEDFFRESYAGLDSDGDHYLSDEEWVLGYNHFYDDYVLKDEAIAIDSDGDGEIEYTEYYDVLYETDYFSDIDIDDDNYVSEYELANYVFNNWDINDTGLLSRSEFKRFVRYYWDV